MIPAIASIPNPSEAMLAALRRMRAACAGEPATAEQRRDRLERAIAILIENRGAFTDALTSDFGHRSAHETLLLDLYASVAALEHARDNVGRWMKPEKRHPIFPFGLLGAKARVHYVPKGVVGIISPWNLPLQLTFGPLAGALAAGNRVLIKPSEYTPATAALIAATVARAFGDDEVAVFTGGPDVAAAFSRLPLDHLLFTGSTSVARNVMRAAADNLVPLTLELGGKSPAFIGRGFDLDTAATRIMAGKVQNAGQICVAPDYALVPEEQVEPFVAAATRAIARMFPTLRDNPDYTAVLGKRHAERLRGYLQDARARGARIIELNPAGEELRDCAPFKIAPTLVLDPREDMQIMQEEIFGPLLPVKPYREIEEAIAYVQSKPRPLALYVFMASADERNRVLERTTSGGVTVNDTLMHVTLEDLPFGGIGPSGMGAYHGFDGFRTFSHARAVYTQARVDFGAYVRPPYGAKMEKLFGSKFKR